MMQVSLLQELIYLIIGAFPLLMIGLAIFFAFLILALVFRAFKRVGFTTFEVALLLFIAYLLRNIDIPLFTNQGGVTFGFNLAGCLIPVYISVKIIKSGRINPVVALIGIIVVASVSFQLSEFVPEKGIMMNPLIPTVIASILSVVLCRNGRLMFARLGGLLAENSVA